MDYSILGGLSLEQAAAKYKRRRLLCAGIVLAAVAIGATLYLLHTPQIGTLCLILCIPPRSALCTDFGPCGCLRTGSCWRWQRGRSMGNAAPAFPMQQGRKQCGYRGWTYTPLW